MISASYFIENTNLNAKERLLLQLSLAPVISQKDIDQLLAGYDIDAEPIHFNLMLAHLAKQHHHLNFPQEIMPRLDGVLRYFLYKNASLGAAFKEIAGELRKHDIPLLLMKGIAMKHLRPGFIRPMFDVDFAVPDDRMEEAVQLALQSGYQTRYSRNSPHSVDLDKGKNISIDIHRFLIKSKLDNTGNTDRAIWSRATKIQAFGGEVFMPIAEDQLFLSFTNAYHNITHLHEFHGNFMWLFDCSHILQENQNFDWNIVLDNAGKVGLTYQTKIMLELLRHFLPDLRLQISPAEINLESRMEKVAAEKLKWDILHNKIAKVRHYRERLHLLQSSNWADLVFWTKIRAQYRFFRTVQKNSMANYLLLNLVAK
jgi:hypothetical protein